ncbi:hypothetical protein HOF67_03535 [Candidatus Peregrinibacteria bacterium]|nr:hypothetical protein [Candidatus Peregrinibacteria bacterium]
MFCDGGICSLSCTPNCFGKDCGSDGCNGLCGYCNWDEVCSNGICAPNCVPDCFGNECGNDGCGGNCGNCAFDETCVGGTCEDDPPPPENALLWTSGVNVTIYFPDRVEVVDDFSTQTFPIPADSSINIIVLVHDTLDTGPMNCVANAIMVPANLQAKYWAEPVFTGQSMHCSKGQDMTAIDACAGMTDYIVTLCD